jgi:glycosidase
MKLHKILFLVLGLALIACQSAGVNEKPVFQETRLEPSWIQDGLIYELFVRDFSEEGSFLAIIPLLGEIKSLGVETIWLMPIHPIGVIERKGSLGSPYSIKDYYDVDPDYGSLEDFKILVEAVHDAGMHLVIDLVVNHTAWDNPWITEHPEWYTKDSDGNIIPPIPDWSDVADLDFSNEELRAELVKVMKYWVEEFDIDGYRVDTASMVPQDFWDMSIPQVMKVKDVLFLGETSDTGLSSSGYQLVYSWDSYSKLKSVFRGSKASVFTASSVRENSYFTQGQYMRFITNHDETAWDASPVVLFGGLEGSKAAAVAHMYMEGIPLIYNGQEIGNSDSWAFFEKWNYDWNQNPDIRAFYEQFGSIWTSSEALRFGDFFRVSTDNPENIISYIRRSENEEILILVNVRDEVQSFLMENASKGSYLDLFSSETIEIEKEIVLEPYGFLVIQLR